MNRLRRKNAVLEVSAEGLCSLDPRGRVVFMNHAAENRLGIARGAGESQRFHDMIHRHVEHDAALGADCPLLLAMRIRSRVFVEDDWFVRGDGTSFHVSYSVNPIMRDGDIDGFVLAFRDTTETRRRMDSLEYRESRLLAANHLARIGRWDWDLVHNALTWPEETFDALGVPSDAIGSTFESFFALVPERERARVKREFREAMESQVQFATVHHFESPDLGLRRVETRGLFVYAQDGTPVAAWGTHQDLGPAHLGEVRSHARHDAPPPRRRAATSDANPI